MEKEIKFLNNIYLLTGTGILFIFALGGAKFIINSQNKDVIYLSISLLTFISIFFIFIYTQASKWMDVFKLSIEKFDKEKRKNIRKDSTPVELRKTSVILEEKDLFEKSVNPKSWMYIALFSFIFTILLSLIEIETVSNATTDLMNTAIFIKAILFHIGLGSTIFLVISLVALDIIYEKNKKGKT